MVRITPKNKGTRISNFDIDIHRIVNVHTDSQRECVPQVELSAVFENGRSTKSKRVDLSKLTSIDWYSWDYRANFNIAASTAKHQIANDLLLMTNINLPMGCTMESSTQDVSAYIHKFCPAFFRAGVLKTLLRNWMSKVF